jgi:hypothetical protein
MGDTPILLGYVGLETVLPVASFLAGILGVLLMFGKDILLMVKRGFLFLFRKRCPPA